MLTVIYLNNAHFTPVTDFSPSFLSPLDSRRLAEHMKLLLGLQRYRAPLHRTEELSLKSPQETTRLLVADRPDLTCTDLFSELSHRDLKLISHENLQYHKKEGECR